MTQQEAVEEACRIVGMAYQSLGRFNNASDCFCHCSASVGGYANDGFALAYVRRAVKAALIRDGYTPIEVK